MYETLELCIKINPMTQDGKAIPDGYDWSENFDGKQTFNGTTLYYNFGVLSI